MGDSMSSIVVSGDTSGAITIAAPAVSGTNTLTLPASTGTVALTSQLPTAAPAFSAYPTSQQTGLSQATMTKVVLGTKEYDTATCFNNTGSTATLNGISVPSYSFAPNVAGYYMITGTVWGTLSGQITKAFARISRNDTTNYDGNFHFPSSVTSEFGVNVQTILYMNGTSDYVNLSIYAETNNSANYSLSSIGLQRVRFNAAQIRSN